MRRFLTVILLLLPTLVKSQGANTKKDTILLKSFNKGDTLVYDLGHNKLYLELPLVLKYLKNYHGTNIYNRQEIALLTKTLKHPKNGIFYLQDTLVFNKQTNFIDTTDIRNKYIGVLNQIIPNMISEGQVMILDKGNNRPVPYLVVTKHWDGTYVGAFTEITAFLPDGKRLCNFTIYEK